MGGRAAVERLLGGVLHRPRTRNGVPKCIDDRSFPHDGDVSQPAVASPSTRVAPCEATAAMAGPEPTAASGGSRSTRAASGSIHSRRWWPRGQHNSCFIPSWADASGIYLIHVKELQLEVWLYRLDSERPGCWRTPSAWPSSVLLTWGTTKLCVYVPHCTCRVVQADWHGPDAKFLFVVKMGSEAFHVDLKRRTAEACTIELEHVHINQNKTLHDDLASCLPCYQRMLLIMAESS